MTAKNELENAKDLLKRHGQAHILAFWNELDGRQRRDLLTQIGQLDFSKIDDWVAKIVKNPAAGTCKDNLVPPGYYAAGGDTGRPAKYVEAVKQGKKLISEGKVAAFVVAGGQGTRLKFNGPKGNFPISPVRNKTLFRLFAETIAATQTKYGAVCPWYIMTSPLNHRETTEIFRSNNYYGLNENNVFIFQQGTLPNFSFDGKILLAEKAKIACSPDGHGGSLKALYASGAVEDMKRRGVEFISYFQVDNPLIKIFDPLFIGLHALDEAEMSSKTLMKAYPKEKVGNFCLIEGKMTVIEYLDLPDEIAEKRQADGSLTFKLGSIAIHIINRSFVEKLNTKGFSLPLHRAEKKIAHINQQGNLVKPSRPNGVKLESFVFDALPLASKSIILETLRSEEFAPVKDATGTDSPETTRKMMVARAADRLESAGVTVPRRPDGSPDCLIEIAPGFAPDREDIRQKPDQIPQIRPGDEIYLA